MKNNLIILIVGVIIVLSIIFLFKFSVVVTDFESCVAAGNPVMESFPEQCMDSISGKTFVKEYPEWRIDGIILMQHETEGFYGCFGCNETLCIDPIIEMKTVLETVDRHCNSDFEVVE